MNEHEANVSLMRRLFWALAGYVLLTILPTGKLWAKLPTWLRLTLAAALGIAAALPAIRAEFERAD